MQALQVRKTNSLDEMLGMVITDASALSSGNNTPSLKLALYFSALSPCQDLGRNGLLARVMAQYAHKALPENRETLYRQLKPCGGYIVKSHMDALYAVEAWYDMVTREGTLASFENVGDTYEEQCMWRESIVIKGLGRKCISFALLLYRPLSCQVIPVDRHHLLRLNAISKRGNRIQSFTRSQSKLYLQYEKAIRDEQALTSYADIPSALYAWCVWQIFRMDTDFQSHYPLNVCNY